MELTTAINWFGTLAGLFGVCIAVYLQLINPRRCHPGHVSALFAAGAALIMVFSAAWTNNWATIQALKVGAILLFVTLESVSGYYVWKRAEMAPPREVVSMLFTDDNGNGGHHG